MSAFERTLKLSTEPEFARRAASAWVRAADAGVINAEELVWLLAHLPSSPGGHVRPRRGTGSSR